MVAILTGIVAFVKFEQPKKYSGCVLIFFGASNIRQTCQTNLLKWTR